MTTSDRTALALAQRQLMQTRANDRVLNPPISAGLALSELLGETQASPSAYPTNAQVKALSRVKSTPRYVQTVIHALHRQHCNGGVIVTQDSAGRFGDLPCPHCAQQRQSAAFRQQMIGSGIEGRYMDAEWTDLELLQPLDRLAKRCEDIVPVLDAGACLLLYGQGTGSGKTQAAMLIGKATLRARRSVSVVNMGRLALDVRESYRDKSGDMLTERMALLRLTGPDLLIIDDLGAGESDTAAVERRLLFLALNERQMMRKPTVITSNLLLSPPAAEVRGDARKDPNRPPALIEILGERLIARLQPLTPLHFKHGKNFRSLPADVSW